MAAEPDIHDRTVVERRDPLLGQVFDRRFRIEAKIAAGGFGAIYRVTRIRDGEELALKVLHPNLTSDPGVVARFRREGAALTRLRDPNTITAYELGEAQNGTLYILMELLRGESLYERFRVQGALPWRPVLALARAVCSSLAEAHGLGVIHRDLKPTNIHLEPGADDIEFVKVLDFGIAKILKGSDFDASELTHAGQMIGTLDYMSPEQMVGGQCGPSSDLYTLGIVMYEMIAGKKPFDDANSAAAALAAVLTTTPTRLAARAMVPVDVDRIVMRCLEREAESRFQTADALAAAIDEVLESDEQVTSIALRIAAVAEMHGGRTGIAMPRLTPIESRRPEPPPPQDKLPAALPNPLLDSTLVGHEPVARLPAGPLRRPADPILPASRGSQPRLGSEPPRRPSQPVMPGGFAPAMPALRQMPPPTNTEESYDSAVALESSQDSATRLHTRPEAKDDAAHAATVMVAATGDITTDQTLEAPAPMRDRGALNNDVTLDGEGKRPHVDRRAAEGPPARNKMIASRPTPHAGVPVGRPAQLQVPTNLREAYPTIHQQPPSPTRPATSFNPFDDRPATGVRSPLADARAPNPFDDRPATGVRARDAAYPTASRLPWIALVVLIALALVAAWLLLR